MKENQYSYTYIMGKQMREDYEPRGWYSEESKQQQEVRQRNEWLQNISKKKKK